MPRRNRGPYLNFVKKRGCFYIQWSEAGRTWQRSTSTDDRSEAEIALRRFLEERERQSRPTTGPRDPGAFPIAEALALYGDEHAPHAADPARIGYAIAALIPFWGERMIGDITRETCRAYGRERAKAPGTIRRELAALRAAINYAKEEGRLTYAPTVHLPPKPEGKDRWLRRSEAATLLNVARNGHPSTRPYFPLFVLIALYTGARKEAILSLRWPQVDLEAERINFNPPGRVRTSKGRAHIPIPRRLLTFLKLARKRAGLLTAEQVSEAFNLPSARAVWQLKREGLRSIRVGKCHLFDRRDVSAFVAGRKHRGGSPEGPSQPPPIEIGYVIRRNGKRVGNIKKTFRSATKDAKLEDVTPHTLRHTCGTWLAQAGVPLDQIGGWLGHSDAQTTQLYAHHHPDFMEAARLAADRRRA